MEAWPKENVFQYMRNELLDLAEFGRNNEQKIEDSLKENLEILRAMVSNGCNSGPLLLKTPKASRKNPIQRIETIHEDESVEFEVMRTASIVPEEKIETNDEDDDNTSNRRSRRTASKKAASNIKQQQSLNLHHKLRRPSEDEQDVKKKDIKEEQLSSSEDEDYRPIRQSRTRKASIQTKKTSKDLPSDTSNGTFVMENGNREEVAESKERVSTSKRKHDETRSPSPPPTEIRRSSRTRSGEPAAKKANVIDETLEKSSNDDTLESSIYEDAIGRPAPIHNSTKIIDTTVVLEPKSRTSSKRSDQKSHGLENNLKTYNSKMNETVTLETVTKYPKKFAASEHERMDDEDVVDCTPEVKNLGKGSTQLGGPRAKGRPPKTTHKANPLFSPYATDSVRKRVEAFEQAGLTTPKAVDVDAPTRVTRTKTRAMAAAENSINTTQNMQPVQSVAQKLARKSLAKAKKISLAKYFKDTDDSKENENLSGAPLKPNRLLLMNEKMQKMQLKITPMGKSRLQQPMSVNRLQHTPMSMQSLSSHSKPMSASRTNIVVGMESFIQSTSKQARKLSSAERMEEKKRKANEEDARRKKDEALKAQTEEKKRKREKKELKNKLAREAKEKLEQEKRLKAEKERDEKAKIALQMQEKQREEVEKKKLLQWQRAQEKEARRRQEEQLRLQRLQEQEEMERQLAEQKRKEQEAAERQHQRRHAEARAQQQALAEAAKLKAQLTITKPAKYLNNTHTLPKQVHAPTSYQIESEPDEDDDASDHEDAPKHPVPSWAAAAVRREQLALQMYIPSFEVHRYFDSRQCTPDLTKIFKDIDAKRLKRTSSAIWKTPPRYSMMYNE